MKRLFKLQKEEGVRLRRVKETECGKEREKRRFLPRERGRGGEEGELERPRFGQGRSKFSPRNHAEGQGEGNGDAFRLKKGH